jgi:hypothetical protein
MSLRSAHFRRRAAQMMRLRPVWITYRRITRLDGPYAAQNPPRVQGALAVSGGQEAGAATLAIRAARLQGRVVPGDQLILAGVTYLVTGQVADTGTNVIIAPIAPALAAPASDGAAVTARWAGERRIPARQQDYGQRLIDGQMILVGDQKITLAAQDLAADPAPQDQVTLPDGTLLTVVAAFPARLDGEPITWDLQVRR